MEEASPEKPTMRFLSFANDGQEDADKEAKLKEAAAKIEQAMAKEKVLSELVDYKEEHPSEAQVDPANDTRSLYDRLQEQRNKKKEGLEESHKLSNYITKLDDDDVEYLNEVARKKQEDEIRRRLEIQDALDAKKRLDEQKMLDEERRMKDSLLGNSSSQTIKTKSRISSLIKMKPKIKKSDTCGLPSMDTTLDQSNKPQDSAPLSSTSYKDEPTPEKPHAINASPDQRQDQTKMRKQDHEESEALECTCPKNVMTSIGVLPSLQIVRDAQDSSDKESDNSDDDLYGRLVPRSRKRRK